MTTMQEFVAHVVDSGLTCVTTFEGYKPGGDWPHFEWAVKLTFGARVHTVVYKTGTAHCKPLTKQVHTVDKVRIDASIAKALKPYARVTVSDTQGYVIPTTPSTVDVLMSLQLDAQGGDMSHADFCTDLCYDVDSIKARDKWLACVETRHAMRRLFGAHFDAFMDATEE